MHSGQNFSTIDYDHESDRRDCAGLYKGAWWYLNCHDSNLNGLYHNGTHESYADGVNWRDFRGFQESMKTTEMKVRGQV